MTEVAWPRGVAVDGVHCQLVTQHMQRDTSRFACVAHDDDYFGQWRLVVHPRGYMAPADVARAVADAADAAAAVIDSIEVQTLRLLSDVGPRHGDVAMGTPTCASPAEPS
jgi:hypothetical protein